MTTVNSSSSSSSTGSTYNSGNIMRITGMASGLDVDGLVKSMLTADQTKIDEAKKEQQTDQWKQEAYQSIIKDVKDLQSSYFDVTSSSGSMMSASNYLALAASSGNTSIVNATVTADAATGTYSINTTNVAKSAQLNGNVSINGQMSITNNYWAGKTITLSDGSNSENISIDSSFSGSVDDLVSVLNTKLQGTTNFGSLTVSNDNGKLKFTNATTNDITVGSAAGNSISDLGNGIKVAANNGTTEITGKTLKFALNDDPSNPVSITLPAGISSASALVNYINKQISSSSQLSGNLSATLVNGSYIKFNASPGSEVAALNLKDIGNSISLNNGWNGKNIKLSDGTTGDDLTLSIDSTFSGSIDDLVTTLNNKLGATTNYKDLTVSKSSDGTNLVFKNASTSKTITIAPASGNSIPDLGSGLTVASNSGTATTSNGFGNPDFSGWIGKNITFNVNGIADSTTTIQIPSNTAITSTAQLVSAIQAQIDTNSKLNASGIGLTVSAGTGNSIAFSHASGTVSLSATDVVDLNSQSSVSSSSNIKLSSLVTDKSLNTNLYLNIKYDGQDIAVNVDNSKGDKTIGDLEQAINTATGGKVTATVDDISGQFTLKTSDTGAVASLQIENNVKNSSGTDVLKDSSGNDITTNSSLVNALGLSAKDGTGNVIYAQDPLYPTDPTKKKPTYNSAQQGSDANLTITQPDGTTTTLTETSNNFTVNGVSYNLISAGSSSITVASNSQDVYDKISKFLDKYNTVIDEIQTKLQEKKDYDYPPLTDAQKSSMTTDQITAWETKAKAGILRNDDNLQKLLDDLTSAFTTPLTDSSNNSIVSLNIGSTGSSAIGIDTSDDYTQGAKITITDSQKLKDAITKNSSQLTKLFTNVSPTGSFNDSGIFQRISKVLTNNVGITGTTLNTAILTNYANVQDDYSVSGGMGTGTIPDTIYNQQLLIKKYQDQYTADQTKYYDQFSQLESLMTQMNSQQSAISSMLGNA